MQALVVYDSFYGNTEQIARAIGEALGAQVLRVGDVGPEHLAGVDLLIVGSPTRAFRPSPAISKWLKGLAPGSLQGVRVAAFDTRIPLSDTSSRILAFFVRLFGYAADPIAKGLTKKGGTLVLPPEGFDVQGTEGPQKEGELERAAGWARPISP